MTELLALLSAFYGCHAIVADRTLTNDETLNCMRTTAQVQVYFLTKAELAMMRELPETKRKPGFDIALKRFKAWESANPKTVKTLKAKYIAPKAKKGTLI